MTNPVVGQVWQRKNGRQRLRVGRVWVAGRGLIPSEPELKGQTVVRLHPLNGGRAIISTVPELHERCVQVSESEAR